jgi:hypothetical protein
LAQQEKRAADHPGAEHGEKIVGGKWEREERWGVAVQVVRQKAVINNPEDFRILQCVLKFSIH